MHRLILVLCLFILGATVEARCQSITGEWDWGAGGGVVTIRDDGTGNDSRGNTMRWVSDDAGAQTFSFTWSHGFTDRAVLSADGGSLEVVNNVGTTFTAKRRGVVRSEDSGPAGRWEWGVDAGIVEILPDGTGHDGRGHTMTWTPKDGEPGTFILKWSNGYTDAAKLSPDGKSMDIVNNAGTHFSAKKLPEEPAKQIDLNGGWNNSLLHIWQDGNALLVTASWKRVDGKYVVWRGEGTLSGNVATLAIRYSPMPHGPTPLWHGVFTVSADGDVIDAQYTCECPSTDHRVYHRDR